MPATTRVSPGTDPLRRRCPTLPNHWRYRAMLAHPAASYDRSHTCVRQLLHRDVVDVVLEVARSDQSESIWRAPLGIAGDTEHHHAESVSQAFGGDRLGCFGVA